MILTVTVSRHHDNKDGTTAIVASGRYPITGFTVDIPNSKVQEYPVGCELVIQLRKVV